MTLTKLDALRILSRAHWHMRDFDEDAAALLDWRFHAVRRSLCIEDLKPQPRCTEGLNPSGPLYF